VPDARRQLQALPDDSVEQVGRHRLRERALLELADEHRVDRVLERLDYRV
jgi:hypothetical protein